MILAGGKGTRLKPYTAVIPKPLLPLGDRSIIEIILHQLDKYAFEKVYISLGYLSYLIKASITNPDGKWKMGIEFVEEDKPLGTAGALSKIDSAADQLLVINGDTLTDLDFATLIQRHVDRSADITIASHRRYVNIEYGVLEKNENDELVHYREKPVLDYLVSMGVYVVNTKLLHYIHKDTYLDFPTFVSQVQGEGGRVLLHIYEGYWMDLGNLTDINKAMEDYSNNPDKFL